MQAKFDLNDSGVIVIVGSGAGGGTLANELAQKGVDKIVLLEAGRHLAFEDIENDEWTMFGKATWLDRRISAGAWELTRTSPSMPAWHAKAVGGSSLTWAAVSLRFLPHDFRVRSTYGRVADANLLDWPVSYDEMVPYYERAEKKLGVAGAKASGMPPLPKSSMYKAVEFGARKVGYRDISQPLAINSRTNDGRPACQQIGFCMEGCKIEAKWSTYHVEIPRAIATGRVELRSECMVLQLQHDRKGRIAGVLYADKDGRKQLQKARLVCVAGNSIESPRLLLNSASSMFPDGLANSSGQVGRNYMVHAPGSGAISILKGPVNMHRGAVIAAVIRDETKHDPSRGFVGGYSIEAMGLGLPFAAAFLKPAGAWGREITSAVDMYDHMIVVWICGEQMPMEQNRVTLHPTEKDSHGLPVPVVTNSAHANDAALKRHSLGQWRKVVDAIGPNRTIEGPEWLAAHNMGTNRMSARARDGVVNKWGQTHDVRNLFVSDGSQFTSSAAANPGLTIVALAIRQAEAIVSKLNAREI